MIMRSKWAAALKASAAVRNGSTGTTGSKLAAIRRRAQFVAVPCSWSRSANFDGQAAGRGLARQATP